MTIIEEIKKLDKKQLDPITVLTGEDTGQYLIAKDLLLKQIEFDTSELTYAYFDMSETDYAQVDLDLVSLPFFSDEKIVVLDYFSDLTTDKKRHLTDEQFKQFEGYLEHPVETTKLIILAPGKLDGKRRLVKLLKRDTRIFEATPLKEAELRQFFQKEIQTRGLAMSTDVLQHLLVKSNFDFSEINKNIAFLATYKSSGQISFEDVQEAIPNTLQDNIFELSQLLLQSKVDEARHLVKDLILQGEDEIKLLAILLTQFRLYLQVQILVTEGKREGQILAELSELTARKINPYQIKYAIRDSRHLSVGFLEKVVCLLIETDFHIKSGRFEKEYLFDMVLLKIALL